VSFLISRQSRDRREIFVEELAALCGIRDASVLNAFRTVPREDFLPPGPWLIEGIDGSLFPTVGAVNPGSTIGALALKLADDLARSG